MANKFNVPIDKVVQSGPGLAFIAYPEAMARMPLAHFWSISFFLMMLTLGIDTQVWMIISLFSSKLHYSSLPHKFALFDLIISSILDMIPRLRAHKSLFVLFMCMVCYVVTLPMCAPVSLMIFAAATNFYIFFRVVFTISHCSMSEFFFVCFPLKLNKSCLI